MKSRLKETKMLCLCGAIIVMLLISVTSFAQAQRITGLITDSDDRLPLPGVGIKVKGTNVTTSTNNKGEYTIAANAGNVIVFTSIGFETKEIIVSNNTVINVALKATTSKLDEVVVVGYGTQKRKDLTGSISSISSKELATAQATTVGANFQLKSNERLLVFAETLNDEYPAQIKKSINHSSAALISSIN